MECAGAGVPPLRAARPREQREPGYGARGLLPRAQAAGTGTVDGGGHPGGEPLVPREDDLPTVGRADLVTAGFGTECIGPMRGGIDLLRRCAAVRGHPRSAGVHPEMGPYRRQPRVGGGLGRRAVAFHRRVRAGARAGPRLVQRPCLPRDAHAHQSLRPLRRAGGGRAGKP